MRRNGPGCCTLELGAWRVEIGDGTAASELTEELSVAGDSLVLQTWEEADPDFAWKGEAQAALERLIVVQG